MRLDVEETRSGGLRGRRLNVVGLEPDPPHRHWAEIRDRLQNSSLEPKLRQGSLDHLKRNPKVEKSRQQHVAGQSGRTVDMQRSSGRVRGHRPSRGAELNNWSALWLRSA